MLLVPFVKIIVTHIIKTNFGKKMNMYGTYTLEYTSYILTFYYIFSLEQNPHRPRKKWLNKKFKKTNKQNKTTKQSYGPRARDDDLFLVIKHQDHPITFIGEPSNIL